MLLKDLVERQERIVSVSPTATVRDASKTMAEANVGCTAVMDADRLIGILTERDLVRSVLAKDLDADQVLVSDVMTTDIVSGKPNDDLGSAARQMRRHHIRHLPVVDRDDTLLGILSIRDLLREEIRDMRDYIAQREG